MLGERVHVLLLLRYYEGVQGGGPLLPAREQSVEQGRGEYRCVCVMRILLCLCLCLVGVGVW